MKFKSKNNKIELGKRFALLIIGFIGSCTLILYSFNWENTGLTISFMGYEISAWFFAFLLVCGGIIFTTFIKSAIYGEWKLD